MGRQLRYRQKRHEQVHSLKSKSLFGHLVTELRQTQGFTQREAEIVAKPCFTYFKNNLCDTAEGQIRFEIIDGINNHKHAQKETKMATLIPVAYSDIELFEEFGVKAMQMDRCLRIIEEAYCQGGLLDMKRLCFLTQITDRALRDRLHELWDKGIRVPLPMILRKYLDNMSMFRQSYCVKHYLQGEDLEKLRKELYISQTDWEQIYILFVISVKEKMKLLQSLPEILIYLKNWLKNILRLPVIILITNSLNSIKQVSPKLNVQVMLTLEKNLLLN
ncbi:MAG: hypothetical protein PWR10_936 [Halanaerobiales bacterium]|nr:hypothetical protein [Halanaerobiales bacterium]